MSRAPYKPPVIGVCSVEGCEVELRRNPKRKSDMCRKHALAAAAAQPERRRKCSEAMKAFYDVPGRREEAGARTGKVLRHLIATDPTFRDRFKELGRRLGTSGKRGPPQAGTPMRRVAAQRQSERALGDIPLEYRDEHRRNVKIHGIKSAESKRMIKEQVERDTKRFLASGELQQTKGKR